MNSRQQAAGSGQQAAGSWQWATRCLLPAACFLLFSCRSELKPKPQVYTQDDVAVEVVSDVEILYSDSARIRVRVTGPVLHNFSDRENPHQEFPKGVRVEFLDDKQLVTSVLTSKFAIRLQEKGQIVARDSVVFESVKGEKLETEELMWDEKTEKVRTEKFVKVSKPGEVIYGYGLEAAQDFSYWKIIVPKGKIKAGDLEEALE
ncbi:MAG: LPS export ABC transporter periplasmic protein LptC [Saprospiraceae bacterium]|nr:LPS export ABC transporter periplasmic protein LptC [Saprospiraceae bacterium]